MAHENNRILGAKIEIRDGFLVIEARVYTDYEHSASGIQSAGTWRFEGDEYLSGLRVRAQAGGSRSDGEFHDSLYGWSLTYEGVEIDLEGLRLRARFLGSVERKLKRYTEREGGPADFAAYLTRIARAIGATEFAFIGAAGAYHEARRVDAEEFARTIRTTAEDFARGRREARATA